jgi:hypothetical protein
VAEEVEAVRLYLAGKGPQRRGHRRGEEHVVLPKKAKTRAEEYFDKAHFVFETGDIKILRDGRVQIAIFVPYDSADEALKLRDSYGVLLEAKVSIVKRKAP